MRMIKMSGKAVVKQSLLSCAALMMFSGNLMASEEVVEDLFATPFDACLAMSQDVVDVTSADAFNIAECFSSLLSGQAVRSGAGVHTIMQYSSSWYGIAADKGHEQARVNLNENLLALYRMDDGVDSGHTLASEKVFQDLDLDQNGMLSRAEVASNDLVRDQFAVTDLDSDGVLSYGEYVIVAGEATAAGN